MNITEQADHWKYSSSRDWKTALGLFQIKRYDAALFFCHLTLEKLLKGLTVLQTRKTPPFIHDLERLALIARLDLTVGQINDLKAISAFNIAGRYSDDKLMFYKRCTRSYTDEYLSKTKCLILCLKKYYPKH